jgi:hypothetical protein
VNIVAALVNVAALPFASVALTYLYYDLCAREVDRAVVGVDAEDAPATP